MLKIKHVVLDRDGVLNAEAPNGGFIASPGEFQWLPGVLDALQELHGAGIRVSVATNQSGVGRGMMTIEQVERINIEMRQQALRHGAAIAAVFVCPHEPGVGCSCRKPLPGLIEQALANAQFAAQETLVVGDDLRDIEAGERAGVASALVLTGKGRLHEPAARERGVAIYEDLPTLVRAVLSDTIVRRRSGC